MRDLDLIGLFVEPLESIGVSYMTTGGVASVIYGDPRTVVLLANSATAGAPGSRNTVAWALLN